MRRFVPIALVLAVLAVAPAPLSAQTAELVEIPNPDLYALEPVVREQLVEAQTALQLADSRRPAEKASAYGELGRHYHAYGFLSAARACYRNAGILAPDSFDWVYLLGVVDQAEGRFEEAARELGRALETRPDDVPALVHLAEVEVDLGRSDDAAARLRRVLELDPGCLAAKAILGEIALARGDHAKAVELLSEVLEALPAATRLHHPLGMAYRGLGIMDQARSHLQQRGDVGVTVKDPLVEALLGLKEGERVHLLRGRLAFKARDFQTAVAEFRLALAADPESVRARNNLAAALSSSGEIEAAIAELRRALELEPDNPTSHYNLGTLLAHRDQLDEAVEHLTEVARQAPVDTAVRLELAALERRRGRPEAALELYRKVVELDPRNESGRYYEAVTQTELGRFAQGRELLEKALADFPRSEKIHYSLARILAACPDPALRDGEQAVTLAERLNQQSPTVANVGLMAEALAELGRCAEAAEWQRKALPVAEQSGLPDLLASIHQALARYEKGPPCRPPAGESVR